MFDFAAARRMMVDTQVRPSDVTDLRLIAAMLDVPREGFVPLDKQALAYLDLDVPVVTPAAPAGRPARYLLKPMVLAKLIQAAEIAPTDRVLDIGCATGYSSAIISRLAESVVALEEDSELATAAARRLADLGARNVTIERRGLTAGWPSGAPYDVIVLEGAVAVPPKTLFAQLKEGGRLVCVLEEGPVGRAMLYRCRHGHVSGRPIFDAAAPELPGFAAPAEFIF
jgi:protein-L-isoaspartate(D-aspartate) O-methyltransferase